MVQLVHHKKTIHFTKGFEICQQENLTLDFLKILNNIYCHPERSEGSRGWKLFKSEILRPPKADSE